MARSRRSPGGLPATTTLLLVLLLACCLFAQPAAAFGAGSVPPASEFNGYVWRHGDISEVLKYLPASFITAHRFTKLQRRQIYFGNWCRDFSQVIDTTCLETVPEPILRAIVAVMAFMEFGYATDEFDVTRERLGCYTHVEHIDNPKGYPDNAKDVDPRLRGPLDPRELEFDHRTGMKNYIANSGRGWDTSADYIRRQLRLSIELGRKGRSGKHSDAAKESLFHLGAALHTLEDFAAHSNFVELCLRELGEDNVFPMVGDQCTVKVPGWKGKQVPPLVTGTFGMLDIFHSFLGEADDMAVLQSKGSLGELEEKFQFGGMAFEQLFDLVKGALEALSKVTAGSEPLLQQLDALRSIFQKAEQDEAGSVHSVDEDDSSPVQIANANALWSAIEPIFYPHDRIKKWLQEGDEEETEEQAGDQATNELGDYTTQIVWRFLAMMIESSVKELRNAVRAAKEKVDQEAAKSHSAEIYRAGSDASDPSHSDLSKDHFSNVLNQPAGLVSTITTNWATQQVVRCWDNPKLSADRTIDEILKILHHPAFYSRRAPIQQYMFDTVRGWWEHHSEENRDKIRGMLTRESVQAREHEDQHLTLKDLQGTLRGAAEFPGSRPDVKAPPKKPSVIVKGVNEVIADVQWVAGTAHENTSYLARGVWDIISLPGGLVVTVFRATKRTAGWVASGVYGVGAKLWPFGK
ncbi:heterokaryon incompatibility Het-C [Microdochium trichocladiopsis]|uniref:Heterokaryon incompatibility Het-C n=1 Tax=Microdochium trichocladiopsis TaxID=1682393 RepID=A0A9P8XYQ2_9PEZI|nr:heterokaryon incompatibility Het-C [Microdochium trichocladiopsis]KAH7024995.1 heterokaryon incompatibility Het-C [Microdochium trichocladiopsis]